MTISQELFKTTLENGIKRRMPITWGTLGCLEPINAETVSEVITASAEGNYLYTTKVPRPDFDEDASEIGSDEEDEYSRVGFMPNGEEEYIYQLRVKQADRNRRIYTKAQFKDVSTQTWAKLTARSSTYESGTIMRIGELDCRQSIESLNPKKSYNRTLKDLINSLKDASRRKG